MAKKYLSGSNFGISFNMSVAKPLDDRLVVSDINSLYDVNTWKNGDLVTLYTGLTVATASGALYTYIGVAGDDKAFDGQLVEGKIPASLWVAQGGDTKADLTTLQGEVATLKTGLTTANEDIQKNADAIKTKVTALENKPTASTEFSAVKYNEDGLVTAGSAIASVALSGSAADVTLAAGGSVEDAIAEVKAAVETALTDSKVTVTSSDEESVAKRYTITQGKNSYTIDIPKDLVVSKGEVITATADDTGCTVGEKYIKLTIANQDAPLYIAVKDLVDVYTATANAAEVQLTVSDKNEISASIVAVDGSKIEDGTIVKAKLDTTVQASLDKADAAESAADAKTKYDEIDKAIKDAQSGALESGIAAVENAGDESLVSVKGTLEDYVGTASTAGKQIKITTTNTEALTKAVEKANSAVQSVTVSTERGNISVDGVDVKITGLDTAAYAKAEDFASKTDYDKFVGTTYIQKVAAIDESISTINGKILALDNKTIAAGDNIDVTTADSTTTISAKTVSIGTASVVSLGDNGELSVATVEKKTGLTAAEEIVPIVSATASVIAEKVNDLNASQIKTVSVNGKTSTFSDGVASVTVDAAAINYEGDTDVKAALQNLEWVEV